MFSGRMIKIPVLKDRKSRHNLLKEFTSKTFKSTTTSLFVDRSLIRNESEHTAFRISDKNLERDHNNFRFYLSKKNTLASKKVSQWKSTTMTTHFEKGYEDLSSDSDHDNPLMENKIKSLAPLNKKRLLEI